MHLASLSPILQPSPFVSGFLRTGPQKSPHKRPCCASAGGFETAEAAFEEQQWDGRLAIVVGVRVERPDASEDEEVIAHRVDLFD